jgi:ParB/Sulfiredoxin domain
MSRSRRNPPSRPTLRPDTAAPGGDRTPVGPLYAVPTDFRLESLPPADIQIFPEVQPREKIDPATVADYAERMQEGDEFPPLDVFGEDEYILAAGFHRLAAARKAKCKKVSCRVHPGGKREAVLFAAGSNATHGLPRSSADKRRVVTWFLQDADWSKWSDREIARQCAVSNTLVGELRAQLSAADSKPKKRTYTKRARNRR